MWLGEADPVKSIQNTRREDPVRARLSDMLIAWEGMIGSGYTNHMTLANAVKVAKSLKKSSGAPLFSAVDPEMLRNAMMVIAKSKDGNDIDTDKLGRWLRSNKGKIANGLRFMNNASAGHNAAQWYVEQL
jgi:putative DNA primase/helicase